MAQTVVAEAKFPLNFQFMSTLHGLTQSPVLQVNPQIIDRKSPVFPFRPPAFYSFLSCDSKNTSLSFHGQWSPYHPTDRFSYKWGLYKKEEKYFLGPLSNSPGSFSEFF